MDQYAWILWAVLGIFFIIAEVFTLGFVLFWFGIGAVVAAFAAYLGIGMLGQFLVFALVSTVLTIMSRTIFDNYYPHNDGEELKTGVDTMPGQIGTVRRASKGSLNEARVSAVGSNWTAYPIDGEALVEGEEVEIVRVEGSTIHVKRLNKELRGWRDDD